MSTTFNTPDGPMTVTHVDGARVLGETAPTPEALTALQEVIHLAKAKMGETPETSQEERIMSVRRKKVLESDEETVWESWRDELFSLLGHAVTTFNGWGECYATGLTPREAIACRDTGVKQEVVKAYCSYDDARPLHFG